MSASASPRRAWTRRLGSRAAAGVALAWVLLILLWLLAVTGRWPAGGVHRGLAALTLLASLGLALAALAGRLRQALQRRRLAPLLLPALLLLGLAVRLIGIDHEVAEYYYGDEGTYSHHATEINRGELLRDSFVYPHLTFYLDAFLIWLAALFAPAVVGASQLLFGLGDWPVVCRLLLRLLPALLGALTVWPVYALAGRLGGRAAAVAGALLIIASPLYNEGAHLATCDVPAAFFATACLAVAARLPGRPRRAGYLAAGVLSGLAAGAKYPAGLVALAIAALWLRTGLRSGLGKGLASRRPGWGMLLPSAAAVSLATFLLTTPALVARPQQALGSEHGLFFGALLYSSSGWAGVTPPSNVAFYLGHLADSFGWPALVLGVAGLVALGRRQRRDLLWLLPFPLAYFALIAAMGIAVTRNLYPLLPLLAAFLAAGAAAAGRRLGRGRRWPTLALLALCVLPPALATALQTVGLSRPGTRVQAREWVRQHLPPGASILREEYTPELNPAEFDAWRPTGVRFAGEIALDELVQPEVNFVLLSTGSYARFFARQRPGDAQAEAELTATRERYQHIFDHWPQVASFPPSATRLGPGVALYRAPLPPPPHPTKAQLGAPRAFLPDGGMRTPGGRVARFTREGQWALFRTLLAAGSYTVTLNATLPPTAPPPRLRILDLEAREIATVDPLTAQTEVRLPADGVYFLYVYLPLGSELRGMMVTAASGV